MKRLIPSFLFLLLLLSSLAGTGNPPAEKVYFNRMNEAVSSPEEAVGWITHQELDSGKVVQRTWYLDGQMNSEKHFVVVRGHTLAHGTESLWGEKGQLLMQAAYQYGRLHGMLRTWYADGQLRRQEEYTLGMLQQGHCLDEQGQQTACPELYTAPQFEGGAQGLKQFVANNLNYPGEAFRHDIEGIVEVSLLVDSLGQPVEAIAGTGLHRDLEAEALRLVMSMPAWEPARKEGQPVSEVLHLQIPFRLADYEGLHISPCNRCSLRPLPGDTLWLDQQGQQAAHRQVASEYLVTEPAGPESFVLRARSMDGTLLEEVHFKARGEEEIVLHGPAKRYDHQGRPLLEVMMHEDVVHGQLQSWWPDGQPRRQDEYRNGRLIEGVCFDAAGNQVPHFPYYTPAEYPGGVEARIGHMITTLRYPPRARNSGKSGTVFVAFTLDKEGNVGQVEITKGVFKDLDQEAMRIVRAMPRWKPAMLEGEPVETRMNMPVRFVLN